VPFLNSLVTQIFRAKRVPRAQKSRSSAIFDFSRLPPSFDWKLQQQTHKKRRDTRCLFHYIHFTFVWNNDAITTFADRLL